MSCLDPSPTTASKDIFNCVSFHLNANAPNRSRLHAPPPGNSTVVTFYICRSHSNSAHKTMKPVEFRFGCLSDLLFSRQSHHSWLWLHYFLTALVWKQPPEPTFPYGLCSHLTSQPPTVSAWSHLWASLLLKRRNLTRRCFMEMPSSFGSSATCIRSWPHESSTSNTFEHLP